MAGVDLQHTTNRSWMTQEEMVRCVGPIVERVNREKGLDVKVKDRSGGHIYGYRWCWSTEYWRPWWIQ